MKTYVLVLCSSLILAACGGGSKTSPPTFTTASATVTTAENTLATTYQASATGESAIVYAISAGADAAEFTLSPSGNLSFDVPPNFELPGDANADNVYDLTVEARDTSNRTAVQAVSVSVTNTNEAPSITSASTVAVSENLTAAFFQIAAADPEGDTLTFSIDSGTDVSLFTATTDGQLSFQVPPDFELPADGNMDNNYELMVVANDGTLSSPPFALTVTVSDIPFAISNLMVAPGANPRSAEFSWDVVDQPPEFNEFVLRSNLDGQSPLTDHLAGIVVSSAAAEISLLQTDFANAEFLIEARDANGAVLAQSNVLSLDNRLSTEELIGYFKSNNSGANDQFGFSVAISGDGNTVAVGANIESSATANDPSDNSAPQSGAVYIFSHDGIGWAQQAYLKAPVVGPYDNFGRKVALDTSGDTLLIAATNETSNATGVNGNMSDNSVNSSGAAYVFARSGTTWAFEAYLKSAVSVPNQYFGTSLAMSGDGNAVAIAAPGDLSSTAGSVYLFSRSSSIWSYDGNLLAASSEANDLFGSSDAMSDNGILIAVGATHEDSSDRGINGNSADNSSNESGAVYVFVYDNTSGIWLEDAYVKAPNGDSQDKFGSSVALSNGGDVLAVGAPQEQSIAGSPADNSVSNAGAAYVFSHAGIGWQYEAMLKSQYNFAGNRWGEAIDINAGGSIVAVGSRGENSSGVGVQSDGSDGNANFSGAIAVHMLINGTWQLDRLLKASNTGADDQLGVAVSLSDSGELLITGAYREDGDGTGIDPVDNDNQLESGAAYLY